MSSRVRFAASFAIVTVVGVGAMACTAPGSSSEATAPPSPNAATTAEATDASATMPGPTPASTSSTAGWVTYRSAQYGYQIDYPPTWNVDIQATRDWILATDRLAPPGEGMNGSADHFIGGVSGDQTAVTGFAAAVPPGMSEDEWLAAFYADGAFCPTIPNFVTITVDGHAGRLDPCYDAQAFVFIGNRVYVFAIHRTEEQPLFRSFLSTVRFP
jgi:hypothetical protein